MNNNANKTGKIIKITLISIIGVLAILFVAYAIFLTVLGAWSKFGQPFWFENGEVYFGSKSCEDSEMEMVYCNDVNGKYNYCYCDLDCEKLNSLEGGPVQIHCPTWGDFKKPIIYLYPESEISLNIKLGNPEFLTVTYPKYSLSGWDVMAFPNGDLIDQKTGKKLYSLYWEGRGNIPNIDFTSGFVVKGEDSAQFLEEKLAYLGLDYKESEEFIVYWLPRLEANPYNYIYFLTSEQIEEEMPIILSTEPDTIIRVRMVFKGVDEYKEVTEQILEKAPERSGFTMVEWGGIELE